MSSSVRVRFIKTPGLVTGAISRLTGSLFDHAEFGTPQGTWIGAHAGTGVQERPGGYCAPTREYVYDIPCLDSVAFGLLEWARGKIGTKYDYKDILGLLFQARSLNSPTRLICSQFVLDGLLTAFGAKLTLNVLPEWTYRVTPETLHLSPIFVGNRTSRKG